MKFYKETNFKESRRIGKIPKEWQIAKIEEICRVRRGASPRPISDPKYFSENGRGWIRISDVTDSHKYLRETTQYLSDKGVSKSVKVDPGDLIMSICATIGKPIILDMRACIHDGFVWFSRLSGEIDTEYLFYLLQMEERNFVSMKQTGTQSNLNTTLVGRTRIAFPCLPEQQKIARILSQVDEAIQKTDEVIAKTERLKKGLMQRLLTKGIGHKEYKKTPLGKLPKTWRVIRLGDFITYEKGRKPKSVSKQRKPSALPYLTAESLRTGIFTQWAKQDSEVVKVGEDDLILIWDGFYCGDIFTGFKGLLSSTMVKIHAKELNLDKQFLYHFLKTKSRELNVKHTGMYLKHVSKMVLESLKVPLPSLQEQRKIAQILLTADRKIGVETKVKEKLERIKQGLMDLLFTGKVRVEVG